MTATTFDKLSAFLSDTNKTVRDSHEKFGTVGSSLLSIRNDLKTFVEDSVPHNVGLSLLMKPGSCQEQYVIRMKHHLIKVLITTYKPAGFTPARKSPDSVKKIDRMVGLMELTIKEPYGQILQALVMALFKHNSESCTFQADSELTEWNLMFQDARYRSTAEIDVYPNETAHYAASPIPIDKPVATKAKKAKAAVLSVPVAA